MFNTPGADIGALFDGRAIFQQSDRELAILSMPALLRPRNGRHSLIDDEKLFCADRKNDPDIFDLRCIARAEGALVGKQTCFTIPPIAPS